MKNETDSAEGRKEPKISSTDAVKSEELGNEELKEAVEPDDQPADGGPSDEGQAKAPWRIKAESKRNVCDQDEAEIVEEGHEDEEDFEDQEEHVGESEAHEFDDNDDPLGQAYDLECGDVLKPSEVEVRHAPWKSKISTPREFFGTEVLYRHDILPDADRELVRGRYRIELKGAQGGIWTLTLGDQIEVVNRVEEADVVISMQQKDFLDLVNGVLNPQLAILAKKIKIQGDTRRAIYFQSMLSPNVE